MLVDYNTATTGCLAEPRAQLICQNTSTPAPTPVTPSPTKAPTTPSAPTPPSTYVLMERGVGSSCTSNMEPVSEEQCLNAANIVGSDLDLPGFLNVFEWENFVPCGCFLWYNEDGSMLVDYNTATTGCLAEPRAQLICQTSAAPPSPALPTKMPTSAPSLAPTTSSTSVSTSMQSPAPTANPTSMPTSIPTSKKSLAPTANPTKAPTPTPPTSSPTYFLADKSVGGTCPSGSEDVPE